MRALLAACVPERRASCEATLAQVAVAPRQPDCALLVLDGWPDGLEPPSCPLPVLAVRRSARRLGPGARWRAAREELPPCALAVSVDDDADLSGAPGWFGRLEDAAGELGAAAAAGVRPDGKPAPPGGAPLGPLVMAMAGWGLALRVRDLDDLEAIAAGVRFAGGRDPLGPLGDDQALVSALLWLRGVPLAHAGAGDVRPREGTQVGSQSRLRRAGGDPWDAQARLVARVTGWPWPEGGGRGLG